MKVARWRVQRAFLFGSFARNQQKIESDIDILVELMPDSEVTLFQFTKMKLELEKLLHKKVDLQTSNSVSAYILPYIEKEKSLIYERKN